jgi:hypothetical protein
MPTIFSRSIHSGSRELGEPAHGIAREAGRDRGVRAVAQQTQRDVHADLGAPPGEQRARPVRSVRGVALARG